MARGRLLLILVVLTIAAIVAWWAMRLQAPSFFVARLRLTPVSFTDLPGWRTADPRAALIAFSRSCQALAKKQPAEAMGGIGYAGKVSDWMAACRAIPARAASAAQAREFFESWARPVAVGNGGDQNGIFTGYYEAQIAASRTQHGAYQTPVYGTPGNLVSVDAGLFVDDLSGRHFTGCVDGHKLVKCPARAEIDANGLKQAKILFYANDPVSVFFLHIQGSGRVQFDDGTSARVNYDSQNGQPYTAIGKTLIRMGVPRDGMSMQVIRKWLKDHPADAQRVMETDKSFIFFREEPIADPDAGPAGSEGVALTPAASLAVDMKVHPLGAPMFVAAKRPDANPARGNHDFDRLMVAQDSGGAIKGAVRGDVFWGFGSNAALIAGRMKSAGKLYVLLPKALAGRLGKSQDFRVP
ncbi:MAG: MltA domain-containing protein [Proteobacteria bacterium]|nr:MltA domain-containing protein [Pseudomonadota bacterium]